MRIGIDCRLWNESGVGRYIRNLVYYLQRLDKKNEYVLFVNSKNINEVKGQPPEASLAKGGKLGVDSWKIVPADIRWHTIEEQIKFPDILNKENLDLVHFPYFSVPIFYSGKFVVTIHDLIINQFGTGKASTLPLPFYKIKRLGYKIILKQTVNKAVKIIAVSESTKNDIIRLLGVDAGKIVVTHEGVTSAFSSLASSVQLEKPKLDASKLDAKRYFLYVGNAYPHKNLERMLEAVAMMKNKGLMINVVMVGREDYFYKKLKEKVKKMNLVNNVIFYGEATDEQLSELYRNAKALILPSLMEGFGLPALEAMANKCLVLASDIAAFREVCREAAIYFNPYDVDDIAKKMKESLLNDFSKNIAEGLKRAKMFSWRKMAEQTLKVYKEVLIIK